MVKALLQGATPSRPLLVPVIFSLGARLQNLPLPHFLANPTKIVNALRQIHSVLKVDGLACYFDPFLEAVALGCKREWRADGTCTIAPPSCLSVDDLRERLKPADGLSGAGHIPVACEVLRRLKTMLEDEPALMVRASGPLSLAAMLSSDRIKGASPPRDLIEFAAEVIASVSKSFAEAGADIIFLAEDFRRHVLALDRLANDLVLTRLLGLRLAGRVKRVAVLLVPGELNVEILTADQLRIGNAL